MTDGCYPRLNATLIQSQQYNGCPLASVVGTIQHVYLNSMTARLKCCDGGFVPFMLDPDYAVPMMGLADNQAVEIMGTIDEMGVFQMFIYRDLGTDFDMELYNDLIMKVMRDNRYFDYFGATVTSEPTICDSMPNVLQLELGEPDKNHSANQLSLPVMKVITELPLDILLCFGEFLDDCCDDYKVTIDERLYFAASIGDDDMIDFYTKPLDDNRYHWEKTTHDLICPSVAAAGNLSALKRVVGMGHSLIPKNDRCYSKEETSHAAAGSGCLEVLKWVCSQGCSSNEKTFVAAAGKGNMAMVTWLRNQGCPWNEETFTAAAENGHLVILRWLQSQGCPWNEGTFSMAAYGGHFEVLTWLRSQGCPWNEHTCALAAARGRMQILQWLRSQGCPWDGWACTRAARSGQLETLKWLRSQGCPWNNCTCEWAAMEGQLETLKWLHSQGCPWDEDTCKEAARHGHLETLQWLHNHGCPWDEETCEAAATEFHFEMLQWLHSQGCPWDERTCAGAAGCSELKPWEDRYYGKRDDERLVMLQWLRSKDCPWDQSTIDHAGFAENLEVGSWARDNGCPCNY